MKDFGSINNLTFNEIKTVHAGTVRRAIRKIRKVK